MFNVLAQSTKSLETSLSVILQIGTIALAVISFIVTMWQRKKQSEDQAQAEAMKRYCDEAIGKLVPVVTKLEQAEQFHTASTAEFKTQAQEMLKQLNESVKSTQHNCVRHQNSAQAEAIIEIKRELERIALRFSKLDSLVRSYQDAASDKYVKVNAYQRDTQMWTTALETVQQSLKDLSATMLKLVELRVRGV